MKIVETTPMTETTKEAKNVVAFKDDVKRVEDKVDALTKLVETQTTIIKRLIQGIKR
jgi:ubiquinone biosynthesis protein UbiJ